MAYGKKELWRILSLRRFWHERFNKLWRRGKNEQSGGCGDLKEAA